MAARQQEEQREPNVQMNSEDEVALLPVQNAGVESTSRGVGRSGEGPAIRPTSVQEARPAVQSMAYERIEVSDHGRQHNGNLNVNGNRLRKMAHLVLTTDFRQDHTTTMSRTVSRHERLVCAPVDVYSSDTDIAEIHQARLLLSQNRCVCQLEASGRDGK